MCIHHTVSQDFWVFYLFEFHDRICNVCKVGKNLSLSIAKVGKKSLTESYVSHFLLPPHFVLLYILMHWSCPINLQYLYNTKNHLLHDFKYCVAPSSKLPYKSKIYLTFTQVASPCGSCIVLCVTYRSLGWCILC